MRDASGDVVNHDDVVTCDVITSDVITSDDITSIDITSDMVDDDVQSNILAGQGPLVNDGINYGGLMLEEQIVETSEDAFFQVVENETSGVPSAGHLVTMSADGMTLSSEAFNQNVEGEEEVEGASTEEEEEENCEDRKEDESGFSVLDAREVIEVDEDLVPYQEDDEAVVMPDEEEPEGTKRLFIQDANGQVFYIQCPEGFTVEPDIIKRESPPPNQSSQQSASEPSSSSNDGLSFPSSSAKRLSAWLSPMIPGSSYYFSARTQSDSSRKRSREELPALNVGEINRQLKDVLPTMTMERATAKKDPEKIGQRVKKLTQKLAKEFKETKMGLRPPPKSGSEEIKYETGFDPVSGEVKGPDIEFGDIATSSFVEREVNSAEDVCKLWTLNPRDKQILRKKGIKWREGPWGEDEVEILDENIKNYCLDRGYEDPSKVIFSMSKEDRKDFYPIISRGICRPVFAVYRRVLRDYDPNNHKGVYSQAELDMLNRLLQEHGTDYKLIAETLGRSIESVRDRCRHLSDGRIRIGKSPSGQKEGNLYNRGKWTTDEEKKLIIAVHEVERTTKRGGSGRGGTMSPKSNPAEGKGTGKEALLDDIPWSEVAALVQTRTASQCRRKWAETLKRSAESKKEAVEEKSTDFALLSNLNKVLTPEPTALHLQSLDVVSATAALHQHSATPINLTRFQDETLLHHQLQQSQIFQSFQQHQLQQQIYQHNQQQPQHIDFVVTRPKHPQEELILFEGVDDQTFSNLQLSYITPI